MNYLLLLVLVFSGCTFKESRLVSEGREKGAFLDSDTDGDGLSDSIDHRPLAADFPFLRVNKVREAKAGFFLEDKFVSVKYPMGWKSLKHQYAFDKATRIIFDYLTDNRDSLETLDFGREVLYSYPMGGDLKASNFYKLKHQLENGKEIRADSGLFSAKFKLSFSYPKGITSVSDIIFRLRFVTKGEETNIRTYKLMEDLRGIEEIELDERETFFEGPYHRTSLKNLDASKIRELLLGRGKAYLTLEDFHYRYGGKTLFFSKTFSQVRSKNAQLIFTDGQSLSNYFVRPGISLFQALRQMGHQLEGSERGEILSIERKRSSLVSLENIKRDQHHLGMWVMIGAKRGLNTILKAGKTYLVGYRTAGQLLRSRPETVELFKEKRIEGGEVIPNLLPGDILEFEVSKIRKTPYRAEMMESKPCECELCVIPEQRPICRRDWRTCSFKHFVLRWREEAIPFNRSGKRHLSLEFGNRNFPLMGGKDWVFVEDNQKLLLSFEVTERMLNSGNSAKFKVGKDPFPRSLVLGYEGLFPKRRITGPNDCRNPDLKLYEWKGDYQYHFIVTLRRMGIKRGQL